CLQGYSSPWTF
nr:immunoglobulin light chain junction region [Macaca mulatta]